MGDRAMERHVACTSMWRYAMLMSEYAHGTQTVVDGLDLAERPGVLEDRSPVRPTVMLDSRSAAAGRPVRGTGYAAPVNTSKWDRILDFDVVSGRNGSCSATSKYFWLPPRVILAVNFMCNGIFTRQAYQACQAAGHAATARGTRSGSGSALKKVGEPSLRSTCVGPTSISLARNQGRVDVLS